MPLPYSDLLNTALLLARQGATQTDFRRSTSTSYYALFHWLARTCADMLVGSNASTRSQRAWRHVYRRLEHRHAKNRCAELKGDPRGFPKPILRFAEQFVAHQEKRELADYDPDHTSTKSEAVTDVTLAAQAILGIQRTHLKDRTAFAVWVLFPKPRD